MNGSCLHGHGTAEFVRKGEISMRFSKCRCSGCRTEERLDSSTTSLPSGPNLISCRAGSRLAIWPSVPLCIWTFRLNYTRRVYMKAGFLPAQIEHFLRKMQGKSVRHVRSGSIDKQENSGKSGTCARDLCIHRVLRRWRADHFCYCALEMAIWSQSSVQRTGASPKGSLSGVLAFAVSRA